jgi:hypothetical protein
MAPQGDTVTDRLSIDQINSDQLDELYDDLAEARQSAAAIAAQRDRLRQRMNTLADRWDNALAPDKAYARTLRNEISCAPFDPDGAMTVQEYTERGRKLWVFRCWGTDTCDGWLGLGHHTQTSALVERERHVVEAHIEETGQRHPAEATLARITAYLDSSDGPCCESVRRALRGIIDGPAEQPRTTADNPATSKEAP